MAKLTVPLGLGWVRGKEHLFGGVLKIVRITWTAGLTLNGAARPLPRGLAPGITHCSQPETPARSGRSGPQGFCLSEHESLAIP